MNAGDYANWLQPISRSGDEYRVVRQRPAYVLKADPARALVAVEATTMKMGVPYVEVKTVSLAQLEVRSIRPPFNYVMRRLITRGSR